MPLKPVDSMSEAPALTGLDSSQDWSKGNGRLVYDVMTAHVLSGSTSQRVHLIDHAVIFNDRKLFMEHVVEHFLAYARFRGCDCGAALRFTPASFDFMKTPKDFVKSCQCTHDFAHMTSIISPDFFGTKISEKSRFLSRDDRSLGSSSSSELEDNEYIASVETDLPARNDYLRWPSPINVVPDDGPRRRVSAPINKTGPDLQTWLREADYFRRISFDTKMQEILDRLLRVSIDIGTETFLKLLCRRGRLFAELAVQHFTRLHGNGKMKTSMLLECAHTRVAEYLVSIWHPDKEHDFVYRATLREAIEVDNVHAFRLLAPTIFYMHQRQYRAAKYLLLDLVHRKCWNILRAIVEDDTLARQLRKAGIAMPSARTPSGFAQYPPLPKAQLEDQCLNRPASIMRILLDITNTMDYSILLNDLQIGPHGELSAPIFEYLRMLLPAPDWLSERDLTGYGSFVSKYYANLSPRALRYILQHVQPNSTNWRDCVKRHLSENLRWGKQGREKLLFLCEHKIELCLKSYDAILAQREYWKLTDEDLERIRAQVV